VIHKSYRARLRLCIDVSGSRYDSKIGEERSITWRMETPRVVSQARAKEPIDWGGAMVRFGDYEVIQDDGTAP
jgi:hypothetical protein